MEEMTLEALKANYDFANKQYAEALNNAKEKLLVYLAAKEKFMQKLYGEENGTGTA